jgi:membrane-associated two-gene conflict system component 1 (EACC1)
MTDADNVLEVKVEAASRLYDQNDPAFLQQVSTLQRDISAAGIQVLETELPGRKGGSDITPVVQAIVAGGPGLVALCGVVRLWIKQRGDRLIRLTVRGADERDRVLELDGRNVSDEKLVAFFKEFSAHLK